MVVQSILAAGKSSWYDDASLEDQDNFKTMSNVAAQGVKLISLTLIWL